MNPSKQEKLLTAIYRDGMSQSAAGRMLGITRQSVSATVKRFEKYIDDYDLEFETKLCRDHRMSIREFQLKRLKMGLCSICGKYPIKSAERCEVCYSKMINYQRKIYREKHGIPIDAPLMIGGYRPNSGRPKTK